jgi:hypothetical protein
MRPATEIEPALRARIARRYGLDVDFAVEDHRGPPPSLTQSHLGG